MWTAHEDLTLLKSYYVSRILDSESIKKNINRSSSAIICRWNKLKPQILSNSNYYAATENQEQILDTCLLNRIQELEKMPKDKFTKIVSKFTPEIDARILDAIEKYGQEWNIISLDLKLPPKKIQYRYHNHLRHDLKGPKKPFTEQEDNAIKDFIDSHGNEFPTYVELFDHMEKDVIPGRSSTQIYARYHYLKLKFNRLVDEDLKLLFLGLEKYGADFTKISDQVFKGSKTPNILQFNWILQLEKYNIQAFTIDWNPQNDQALIDAVQKYGYQSWKKIHNEIPFGVLNDFELKARYEFLLLNVPYKSKEIPKFNYDLDETLFNMYTHSLVPWKKMSKTTNMPEEYVRKRIDRIFNKHKNNKWTAEEVEILKKIASEHQKKLGFVHWAVVEKAVEHSKFDCILKWQEINHIRK